MEIPTHDALALFTAEATTTGSAKVQASPRVPRAPRSLAGLWLICGAGLGIVIAKTAPARSATLPSAANSEPHSPPLTRTTIQPAPEHVEFAAKPVAATGGTLSLTADAPSRVSIDGRARGVTPVAIANLPAGDHVVAVTSNGSTITWKVKLAGGDTTSAAFSFASDAAPTAGWLAFSSPFNVQVFEGAALIGSSGAKIVLPAGRHDVRLVNGALGYDERRVVNVIAGRLSSVGVNPPKSTIDINARPWAEVVIDGEDVGQTPLAHVPIRIGSHIVEFHHPQLGDERRTITVTSKGPNRVAVDLAAR
ncbi:MAG TPA: PEGA domain-containing protein [Vicinamibacterales bacterium]|jgi:hypothetical protein